ncbi:MAG TPA: glycine zipper 2TM domain-containing protein [Spongiibacteraceae bacterium]|jgi:uncharacterized protein YcfJ
MKHLACYSAVALLGAASSLACAHGYREDFDYARVTRVEPIYETTSYRVPRDECWNEQVPVHSDARPRSYTAPLLGAIIGGAIGNALGHHEVNKKVGTIAGAALGGSVGRDISYRNRGDYERVTYTDQHVCQTVSDTETREEVVAYRVFYRYNGRDFVTRMPENPGPRLRVRVNIEPDDD